MYIQIDSEVDYKPSFYLLILIFLLFVCLHVVDGCLFSSSVFYNIFVRIPNMWVGTANHGEKKSCYLREVTRRPESQTGTLDFVNMELK